MYQHTIEHLINRNNEDLIDLQEVAFQPEKQFSTPQMQSFVIFSEKLKGILDHLGQMKFSPRVPLLITGPTGSGKELIAHFMHYEVDQAEGEYIAINCSNINKELFESEDDVIEILLQQPFYLEEFMQKLVKKALRKFNGNKAKTARFLSLKREQLYNRYKTD